MYRFANFFNQRDLLNSWRTQHLIGLFLNYKSESAKKWQQLHDMSTFFIVKFETAKACMINHIKDNVSGRKKLIFWVFILKDIWANYSLLVVLCCVCSFYAVHNFLVFFRFRSPPLPVLFAVSNIMHFTCSDV